MCAEQCWQQSTTNIIEIEKLAHVRYGWIGSLQAGCIIMKISMLLYINDDDERLIMRADVNGNGDYWRQKRMTTSIALKYEYDDLRCDDEHVHEELNQFIIMLQIDYTWWTIVSADGENCLMILIRAQVLTNTSNWTMMKQLNIITATCRYRVGGWTDVIWIWLSSNHNGNEHDQDDDIDWNRQIEQFNWINIADNDVASWWSTMHECKDSQDRGLQTRTRLRCWRVGDIDVTQNDEAWRSTTIMTNVTDEVWLTMKSAETQMLLRMMTMMTMMKMVCC